MGANADQGARRNRERRGDHEAGTDRATARAALRRRDDERERAPEQRRLEHVVVDPPDARELDVRRRERDRRGRPQGVCASEHGARKCVGDRDRGRAEDRDAHRRRALEPRRAEEPADPGEQEIEPRRPRHVRAVRPREHRIHATEGARAAGEHRERAAQV
jgi:hypothetical protein